MRWLAAGLLICILVAPVLGITVTGASGESWIKWSWGDVDVNLTNETTAVYIDGIATCQTYIFNQYYLEDLNPDEEHRIDLQYNGSFVGNNTAKTQRSLVFALAILAFSVLLLVVSLLTEDPKRGILVGLFGVMVALYFAMMTWAQLGSFSVAGYIIAGIIAVRTGIKIWEVSKSAFSWI